MHSGNICSCNNVHENNFYISNYTLMHIFNLTCICLFMAQIADCIKVKGCFRSLSSQ